MNRLSTFLYARPSFIEGVSRVVDVGGTLDVYNESESGEVADWLAIFNDWRMIGTDMRQELFECQTC
jgi:hypothetical protein